MNNINLSIHSKLTKFKYYNNIICILNTYPKKYLMKKIHYNLKNMYNL